MQAQVVAGGRAADAGALEQGRRLDRPAGDDDGLRPDRDGDRRPVLAGPLALDADASASLGQHPLDAAADEDLGAVLRRVDEVGLLRRALRAGLLAEAEVAGGDRVVGLGVGVARDQLEVSAPRLDSPP